MALLYPITIPFLIDQYYNRKTVKNLSREGIIRILVDYFEKEKPGIILDKEELIKGLVRREKVGSTGIGKGVAVPHIRGGEASRLVKEDFCVLGITKQDVDFDTLDGEPVHIFFLLVAPGSCARSLAMLEKTSAIIRNAELRKLFENAKNEKEVLDILIEADM